MYLDDGLFTVPSLAIYCNMQTPFKCDRLYQVAVM
jgi:hypothetical protein